MQKLSAAFNILVGFFQRGGGTIPKSRNTHNAPQHHNTLHTMAIDVRVGQAAAARHMAQVAAASSRLTAVLFLCARGGKFSA